MSIPLVSIIIPTYNRAHLIVETLDSVMAQTYTNWECIVVDDGSTDETTIILENYIANEPRFQYHHRPSNRPKGANACRNYGFELSRGEYVNWFDDDDIMLPQFIENKVIFFSRAVKIVICSGIYVNEKLQNEEKMPMFETNNLYKDYLLWRMHLTTNSVMIKKSFLQNKKLFLNEIKRGQETELFSRLFYKLERKDYKIIIPPLFLYRLHESSKTFKNKSYVSSYKKSQAYIAVENLKRSITLDDKELINHFYRMLLSIFYGSIDNNNIINSKYILKRLLLVSKQNKVLSCQLFIGLNLILLLRRRIYKIEQFFNIRLMSYYNNEL